MLKENEKTHLKRGQSEKRERKRERDDGKQQKIP